MGALPFPLVLKGRGVPPWGLWPGLAGESCSRGLERLQLPPASSNLAECTQHTLPWSHCFPCRVYTALASTVTLFWARR